MDLTNKTELIEQSLIEAELAFGQGADSAWDEAVWMVLHVIGALEDPTQVDWQQPLSSEQLGKLDVLLKERVTSRKPLAYILGETWFAGNRFVVDERVIVPRSYLSEWIDDQYAPWVDSTKVTSVLDMCCGCGCIGISTALAMPNVNVTLSDLSSDALQVAEQNIVQHQLQKRVRTHLGNGFAGLQNKFDLIVCNPPYVSASRMATLPKEFQYEPPMAFDGGEAGLDFIEPFLAGAFDYLNEHGNILLEAGSASNALEARYPDVPFTWLSTEYDEMVILVISREELWTHRDTFSIRT